MTFLSILLVLFLERQNLLATPRKKFMVLLNKYVDFFTNQDFKSTQGIEFRLAFMLLPVVVFAIITQIIKVYAGSVVAFAIYLIIYALIVDIRSWRKLMGSCSSTDTNKSMDFISYYATRCFAVTFWFAVLPGISGALAYVLLMLAADKLRDKHLDNVVYATIIDKILFWINLPAYTVLVVYLALVGEFEEVTRALVEKFKYNVSYYYLQSLLRELLFVSIGIDKFKKEASEMDDDVTETMAVSSEQYSSEVSKYLAAVLYRCSIAFTSTIFLVTIAGLLHI